MLLFKSSNTWSPSQTHRAEILFSRYPALEQAYNFSRDLAAIYQHTKVKEVAFKKLALRYNKVEKAAFKFCLIPDFSSADDAFLI